MDGPGSRPIPWVIATGHEHPRGLLLAGGGHSHALLLKRWAMRPTLRPQRRIVLINRHGSALYSGMVPALIAGIDNRDAAAIDLRQLCDRASVAFVQAEIGGIDVHNRQLQLVDRPALAYGLLSLDVGAISRISDAGGIAIKPLEPALAFLEDQDPDSAVPFRVVGAGSAGIEVVLALRRRWLHAPLELQSRPRQLGALERRSLAAAQVELIETDLDDQAGPRLLCTGSQAPDWLRTSGLPVDGDGRVRTDPCLEVIGHNNLFAAGDCAVLATAPRPASGVWAVRAAPTLAHNLEARCAQQPLRPGTPTHSAATDRRPTVTSPGPGGEIGNWGRCRCCGDGSDTSIGGSWPDFRAPSRWPAAARWPVAAVQPSCRRNLCKPPFSRWGLAVHRKMPLRLPVTHHCCKAWTGSRPCSAIPG